MGIGIGLGRMELYLYIKGKWSGSTLSDLFAALNTVTYSYSVSYTDYKVE